MIKNIKLRYILNSNAEKAIEADVFLTDGYFGRGASPAAIVPGIREKRITEKKKEDLLKEEKKLKDFLINRSINQMQLDECLRILVDEIGTDITIAVSIAFARATASSRKIEMVEYLCRELKIKKEFKLPYILVAVFSGGVHSKSEMKSFQQIMACIRGLDLEHSYNLSKDISEKIEVKLRKKGNTFTIGASGGYVVDCLSTKEKICLLQEIITENDYGNYVSIAIDVAAEHLKKGEKYLFEGQFICAEDFLKIIEQYINEFELSYVEDPFDTKDTKQWKEIKESCGKYTYIIGDDLFATQETFLDNNLADGIVIKMNQVGNLTDTLKAIVKAKRERMRICVSHRSKETEDTTMCDLAIASQAEYVKIGGIRRGERLIKYNQLLRLSEVL